MSFDSFLSQLKNKANELKTEALKFKNKDFLNTPIIVLSNLWEQTDKERALVLGANDYLVKIDTTIQEVVDRINGYLNPKTP